MSLLASLGSNTAPLAWLRRAVTVGILKRSLRVALIVGTILNLINQGDVLFGSAKLNLVKLILTYSVPFCVSTYGAVAYRLSTEGTRELASPGAETE